MKYIDLLKIQCKDNTSPMAVYLWNYLSKLGTVNFDQAGNLWFKRGIATYYPLIVAHMDTVQKVNFNKQFTEKKGKVGAKLGNKNSGIGADDKNGIYIAIQLIEQTNIPLKCLFTFGEETGANGSYETNKHDFTNVAYMLQFDRKGNSDVIQYGSDEFMEDVLKIGKDYRYKYSDGIFTDVTVLSQKHSISAVNLSCGYYYAHTENEYTILSELANAANFGISLISTLSKVYPYDYIKPKYNYYGYGKDDDLCSYGECAYCGMYDKLTWNDLTGDYVCDLCAHEINEMDVKELNWNDLDDELLN